MPPLHDLWTLCSLATVLTLAPGPDTMLVLRNVLSRGKTAGIATGFGACCGLVIHATLSAFGLSALLLYSATAFGTVKWLGACYLIYLGMKSLWQAWKNSAEENTKESYSSFLLSGKPALQRSWNEGFFSNVLNPKVVVFYLAILPQVIGTPELVLQRSILFTAIHFIVGNIYLISLSLCLGKIRHLLTRPSLRRKLESITGMFMVAFGLKLAFESTQ